MASPQLKRVAGAFVLSAAGIAGLIQFEGEVNHVYLDPVAIPTVCVGHTATVTTKDLGKLYSHDVCVELLKSDTQYAQAGVRRLVKAPVTQKQYDALVDFTFNVGVANLESSTLLRKLNAGDCMGAADEFPRWNRAKGRVLPGLIKRRAWEQYMFAEGCS
jgi:lysozyme